MACLRFLSRCPCPRCLILKSCIPMIGTKTNTKQRMKLTRVDSEDRQDTIELVRKMMFEGGVNITSVRIENLLKPTSLVPTWVCIHMFYQTLVGLIISSRTRSRKSYLSMGSTSMRCLYRICSTSSSWVCGRPYSLIYFESCMHVGKTKFRLWIHGK